MRFRMSFHDLALLSRRDRVRLAALVVVLLAVSIWASVQLLQPGPPRRIVLASGAASGIYHRYAQQYVEALAREGITVEERMTGGAVDNLRLLLDPKSGVDVALMQGGLENPPATDRLVMLASLYYEPLWIFIATRRRCPGSTSSKAGARPSGRAEAAHGHLPTNCSRPTA